LIAQQDHSTSDFGSRVQFTEVIDLEAVFNRAFLGGQTFPVLSGFLDQRTGAVNGS
jgi:hypothetical protein